MHADKMSGGKVVTLISLQNQRLKGPKYIHVQKSQVIHK